LDFYYYLFIFFDVRFDTTPSHLQTMNWLGYISFNLDCSIHALARRR